VALVRHVGSVRHVRPVRPPSAEWGIHSALRTAAPPHPDPLPRWGRGDARPSTLNPRPSTRPPHSALRTPRAALRSARSAIRNRQSAIPSLRTPHSALCTQWAFIALGSNLGDSAAIIRRAIERLQDLSDQPLRRSSLWQTTPVECPPGSPLFINAVVGLAPRSGETPESLLKKLQALEKQFGRRPNRVRNEPRLLDLDLIAFGAEVRATPRLTLPHPRAHQRRFVLAPLAELAPALILPGQTHSVRQLLKNLRTPEQVTRLE